MKLSLWPVLVLILLFGVSFLVRAFRLDFYSLWYDEVNTVSLILPGTESNALRTIINATGSETLHPLYYLILSAWVKFAGYSVWAIRFPSVVFGSCAVIVYMVMLYQVGGRKVFPFALLLIISPFLMWYSRDARPYALIMFLTGLHLLFYLNVLLNPQSKIFIVGFIVTGVISIYSGIFIGMLLAAEFAWSFFRRRIKEIGAMVLVLFLALPLFWQGYRTFLNHDSERYRDLPTGTNAVRIIGFPQEFFVARSFGPTTDEVRRFPLYKAVLGKSLEVGVEALAIICVFVSFFVCIRSCRRAFSLSKRQLEVIYALAFIVFAVCLQAVILVAITGYQMNARHIGFIFGPLFIIGALIVAYSSGRLVKILFVTPLLLLWVWSSANQLFNPSYITEDFKNVARIIENDEHCASEVIALCNKDALCYYGVKKPIVYLRESPQVTLETVLANLKNGGPAWLVLSRPWSYPNFRAEDLPNHFRILQSKLLPGINMWLIIPINPLK
jgi:hypothetical protein